MNTQLKKAIVIFILDNEKEFQIIRATVEKFRAYIYDSDGHYLIGGEDVANFIDEAIKLLQKQY